MEQKIDFVIPWVDGNDPAWQAEKRKYEPEDKIKDYNGECRYREWGTLKYWFRGVEKFAPWVNQVHFITCGHMPDFLNTEHPKLHIVKHSDYIPEQYLPTFSANPIEVNIHRIESLAEQFVYFNDDMFLVGETNSADFFENGLPGDQGILAPILPNVGNGLIQHVELNDMLIINRHFNKRESFEKNKEKWFTPLYGEMLHRTEILDYWNSFTGFYVPHTQQALLKSTMEEVWQKEPGILMKTSEHRFRTSEDVNQYLFKYWQLAAGNFVPRARFGQYFSLQDHSVEEIFEKIRTNAYKTVCLNDTETQESQETFEKKKRELNKLFEQAFPEKSSFEK